MKQYFTTHALYFKLPNQCWQAIGTGCSLQIVYITDDVYFDNTCIVLHISIMPHDDGKTGSGTLKNNFKSSF